MAPFCEIVSLIPGFQGIGRRAHHSQLTRPTLQKRLSDHHKQRRVLLRTTNNSNDHAALLMSTQPVILIVPLAARARAGRTKAEDESNAVIRTFHARRDWEHLQTSWYVIRSHGKSFSVVSLQTQFEISRHPQRTSAATNSHVQHAPRP